MTFLVRAASLLLTGTLLLGAGSSLMGRALQPDPLPPIYYLTSTLAPPDQLIYQAHALDVQSRLVADLGRPLALDNRLFDQIAWSPDRAWIALGGETSGLYLVNLARGAVQPIAAQGVIDAPMVWSPDGRYLVYVAEAAASPIQFQGQMALWLLDRADGTRRELDRDPMQNARLDWSPDGAQVVYVRFDGTQQSINLVSIALDAKPSVLVMDGTDPAWSPDGEWIAYYGIDDTDQEVYVIRPEGGQAQAVTRNSVQDVQPVWSPDGGWLSYLSARGSDLDVVVVPVNCLADTLTCAPQPLTVNDVIESPFMWSPDGRYLLYRAFPSAAAPQWLLLPTGCLDSAAGCAGVEPLPVPFPPTESVVGVAWG
jgi:Tol biopolymer transport system component